RCREDEPPLLGHLPAGYEQQERLARRTTLELSQPVQRGNGGRGAKAVHGLGGIAEQAPCREVGLHRRDGGVDFRRRAEREDHPPRPASSSAMARSSAVVTFRLRGESGTSRTGTPVRSTRAASSVGAP